MMPSPFGIIKSIRYPQTFKHITYLLCISNPEGYMIEAEEPALLVLKAKPKVDQ